MTMKKFKIALLVCILACALSGLYVSGGHDAEVDDQTIGAGMGSITTLERKYRKWEAEFVKNGGERNVVLSMGWFKGLSTEETSANGIVRLNLIDGTISAEISGLDRKDEWNLWLIDNKPGQGRTVLPEQGDYVINAGTLTNIGEVSRLNADLGKDAFLDFDLDLLVIARSGKGPAQERVLMGSIDLFHKLHRSQKEGRFGLINDAGEIATAQAGDNRGFLKKAVDLLAPSAQAQIGPIPNPSSPLEHLITAGRNIFLNETFGGNGRTCSTCHRENNNFTIDPKFIASLSPSDPLFVAELNPALATGLENNRLLRERALIGVNADGFENPLILRAVPHTLALLDTALTATFFDGTTIPPNQRLGWAGDGAPGSGTLREFAIGAVTQHLTRSLNRVVGIDFRLPTENELDALEAFQRSLGRQEDLDLASMSFKSVVVENGKTIFNSPLTGKCFLCHSNAGSSIASGPLQGVNPNFNIGVQNLIETPASLTGEPIAPDAGFGRNPNPNGGFGNGSFNSVVLVEAADTGPFFHDNSVTTIEGAVEFYNSNAFNTAPLPAAFRIHLETPQVEAVSALLRVLNGLENIRSTNDLLSRAKNATSTSQARELLKLAIGETEDAIKVLEGGGLHPVAGAKLKEAKLFTEAAVLIASSRFLRNKSIDQAIHLLTQARGDMLN